MQTASKKVIRGWAMYDWANSVYNLVITTTFFPIYYTIITKKQFGGDIVTFLGRKFVNTSLYDYAYALAYLIIALLYPVLTSVADSRGNKKSFMKFFCYLGSLGCATIFFFNGTNLWLGILSLMVASMGFVGSVVFYNAFLPETKSIRKISNSIVADSFSEMKKVFLEIRKLPVLKNYLRGFFFYSMGVQTVMLAATLFGSKLLQLADTKLIITIVLIQLVAIPGAIGVSRLSEKFGNLRVLTGLVIFWILICLAAYYTAYFKEQGGDPEYGFYVLAIAVGLIMGGIQSLSRSTYSKLMPETRDTASYFSYYDFTEKLAIVFGMFCFGLIEEITGSMKNSVLSLIVFFVIGFLWLVRAQSSRMNSAVFGPRQ